MCLHFDDFSILLFYNKISILKKMDFTANLSFFMPTKFQ